MSVFGAWVCVCMDTDIAHVHAKLQLGDEEKAGTGTRKKKKKKRDFYTNWAGDVCGTKRVMIRLFHYEQCNFRLQKVFFLLFSFSFLPNGNTRVFSSNKPEGLKCLKKKNTHMQYPCATIKTGFANSAEWDGFMDSGSDMKRSVVIFRCSIRTSCDGRLKIAYLRRGAPVSAEE